MPVKTILIAVLLLAAAGNAQPAAMNPDEIRTDIAKVPEIVVYYFHGTSRCRTCRTIEDYTRQALHNGFASELKKGELELRAINVDLKDNRHYINDYQLFTRSVVVSFNRDGKETTWKRLDRVWELVKNKSEFIAYVQNEIRGIRPAESK